MANEDQYYSPIIEAMVRTATLQKQGERQEMEKQQHADEMKAKADALKQAQKQFDDEHKLRERAAEIAQGQFDLQGKTYLLQERAAALKSIADAQGVVEKGGDANKIPNIERILGIQRTEQSQPENFSPVGGSSQMAPRLDLNQILSDPNQIGMRTLLEAKNKAQGTAEGALPSEQALLKSKLDNEKELKKYESTLEDTDKRLDRESHERIARITANARVKDPSVSPEIFQSLFKLKALGQIKLSPTNPSHMAVLGGLEEAGANVDMDDKEADQIRNTLKLGPIFDQMETFSKLLPKGRAGALLQRGQTSLTEAVGGSSEIMNEWKIARSRAILIGKALEGMTGRPLAIQLKTDLESLPEVGITEGDAKKRIANLKLLLKGVLDSMFSGMPTWQRKMWEQKYLDTPAGGSSPIEVIPDWLKVAPQVYKGHRLDVQESIRQNKPQYKVEEQ